MVGTLRLPGGRVLLLPLAAFGLAALLPWRAADLLQDWQAISPVSTAAAQTAPAPLPAPVTAPPPAKPASAVVTRDDQPDDHLLAEVARRNALLDQREQDLRTRAAQLAAAEQLARTEIAQLTKLRAQVEALVAQQSDAADADLGLLVGLYSNMKPPQAAAVLGKLEAGKAAAILQRLETRSAGPILASMDPSAALAITEELEKRHSPFRR